MGNLDRGLRIILAIAIAVLFFTNVITGTLGIVLLIVAGIFLITSIFGSCLLYMPFRISTRKGAK